MLNSVNPRDLKVSRNLVMWGYFSISHSGCKELSQNSSGTAYKEHAKCKRCPVTQIHPFNDRLYYAMYHLIVSNHLETSTFIKFAIFSKIKLREWKFLDIFYNASYVESKTRFRKYNFRCFFFLGGGCKWLDVSFREWADSNEESLERRKSHDS